MGIVPTMPLGQVRADTERFVEGTARASAQVRAFGVAVGPLMEAARRRKHAACRSDRELRAAK